MTKLVAGVVPLLFGLSLTPWFFYLGLFHLTDGVTPVPHQLNDYLTAYIIGLALHLVIIGAFWRSESLPYISWIWFIKMYVISLISMYYEAHYRILDAFSYFFASFDGRERTFHFAGSSETLIYFLNLLNPYLGDSYQGAKAFCALLGLIGSVCYYKGLCLIANTRKNLILFILSVGLPSTLFWTSQVSKEALIMPLLGLYIYASIALLLGQPWKKTLTLIAWICVYFIGFVREWVTYFMLGPTLFLFVTTFFTRQSLRTKAGLLSLGFLALIGGIVKYLKIDSMGAMVQAISYMSQRFSQGDSAVVATNFHGLTDIALFLPNGIFSCFFRPLPWELGGVFAILAGIENILLLIVMGVSLPFTRFYSHNARIALWAMTALFFMVLPYSFIAPFNLGTGSRFRIQYLPYLVILLVALVYRRQEPLLENLAPDSEDHLSGQKLIAPPGADKVGFEPATHNSYVGR